MSLLISSARNSVSMFFEPLAHFVISPGPLDRFGVTLIVFGPRYQDVLNEVVTTVPRLALEVIMAEGMDQNLSLIEPRRVDWSRARTPPGSAVSKIVPGITRRMTRVCDHA